MYSSTACYYYLSSPSFCRVNAFSPRRAVKHDPCRACKDNRTVHSVLRDLQGEGAARSKHDIGNSPTPPVEYDRSTVDDCNPRLRRQLVLGAALTCAAGATVAPEALATQDTDIEEDAKLYQFVVDLDVVALKGSVPKQWQEDFKQALGRYGNLCLKQKAQLQTIYQELADTRSKKVKRGSALRADAVTVGDSWLGPAIKSGYLQPLPDVTGYRWWEALSPDWRSLVTRDAAGQVDSQGQVWAVPYRWGCNLVAFKPEYLCRRNGVAIRDWSDLLQPRLEGRLAFLDSPRDFLGVAFKTLGLPLNCSFAQLEHSSVTLQQLQARVQQLHKQVRLFSSREHTRALLANDVWAVVGSSQDLIPLALRTSNITLVAPVSGLALWADLWVVPKGASGGSSGIGASPLLPAWFEFGLMPSRIELSRGLQYGGSPLQLPVISARHGHKANLDDAKAELVNGVMPDEQTLSRSEFLMPANADTTAMYNDLLAL